MNVDWVELDSESVDEKEEMEVVVVLEGLPGRFVVLFVGWDCSENQVNWSGVQIRSDVQLP